MRKLTAPDKAVTLPPLRPNAGVAAAYNKAILTLVDAMNRSLEYWLTAAYRANEPHAAGFGQDASPARAMQEAMNRLARQWNKNFKEASKPVAVKFADGALNTTDYAFKKNLQKAGFSVKFQMTQPMNDAYQATIGENVGLIQTIASEHLADVQGMVMRSVQSGRSLSDLTDALHERFDITRRRAALIARDQNNKASAIFNRVRQVGLGIKQARWAHTTASKQPRIDHMEFDGELYDVDAGHDFGDGFGPVLPGQAINCGCTSRSVIPGYNDAE